MRALAITSISLTLFAFVACTASSSPTPEGPATPAASSSSSGSGENAGTGSTSSGGGSTSSGGSSSGDVKPAPLPAGWGASACPAAGAKAGYEVGDAIGKLDVRDCETNAPATIDEVCGASATWIFAAHTHCPTCQATASFTDDVATAVASKNVAVVHVVHDDNGTSCAQWRAAYKLAGLSNVRVYADPTGAVWSKLKVSNSTAPSAFLDKNRVVTYKEHGLSKATVLTQIDAALAR